MTRLSVVLSVYNGATHLRATLDSILGQTLRDFELIVVDDGSTDTTPSILAACGDPRLRVITQRNTGLTRALIRGCAEARGTYIARHDCGDLSMPERFAKQLALLDADPATVFVSCWTEFTGPELEPLYVVKCKSGAPAEILDAAARHGVNDGPSAHGSVMFRRDAYERAGGYRAQFWFGQDWDLWFRLAAIGRFACVPEVLYRLRVEAGSVSMTSRDAQTRLARLSHAALLARMRGEPEAEILAEAETIRPAAGGKRRCARAEGLYFIGEMLRRNGDPRARRYLRDATRDCPLLLKAWLRLAQSLWTHRSAGVHAG